MNVIFLDIDGVMNSNDFYYRRHNTLKHKLSRKWLWIKNTPRWIVTGSRSRTYSLTNYIPPEYTKTFDYRFKELKRDTDPIKWKWLIEFCNRTQTKICISSCWKHHFNSNRNINHEWWNLAFTKLGFIDDTFIGITGKRQNLRGDEIKDWIETNNSFNIDNMWWFDDVEKYAIIDDDSDMLPEQMSSFFHVDGYYGLSPNTLYKIGRYFNKENY